MAFPPRKLAIGGRHCHIGIWAGVTKADEEPIEDWRIGYEIAKRIEGRSLPMPIGRYILEYALPLDADAFAAWSRDVATVIATADIPLAGADGTGSPIATPRLVAFNGAGADAYDPFVIAPDSLQGPRTKQYPLLTVQTLDKPYGGIVTAALILWLHYFAWKPYGTVVTKSDPAEWERGRDLILRATGVPFTVTIRGGSVTVE